MTTRHDGSPVAPTDDHPGDMSVGDPDAQLSGDAAGVICQAEVVEVGLGDDGTDPFDATLLLAGTDPRGRQVAVWMRLTPTAITDLTEQLREVLFAQQDVLGITRHQGTTGDVDPDNMDGDDDPDPGEGRVKRFFDPLGIRHLKDRSPRTTVVVGAAIASLVLLAFILQLLRG